MGRGRSAGSRLLATAVCLAAAVVLAATGSAFCSPHFRARAGIDRRESVLGRCATAQGVIDRSEVTPATAYYGTSVFRRFMGDLSAVITAPWRLWRIRCVAKEVVADVRVSRSKGGASGSGGSGSKVLEAFLPAYVRSHVIARTDPETFRSSLNTTINVMLDSILAEKPFPFEPYHEAIRGPELDHYTWGNDFFKSMVKYRGSKLIGVEHLAEIREALKKGDNVVLLANHQTEADPQVLSILLELENYSDLAEKSIFVAGHKVTTDPLAVPFSMGRNLLTIFSKKYLDEGTDEEKEEKNNRNRQTVAEMTRLFNEGGHIFWVAPSGGRDRRSPESGKFEPAKFDHQSVGLFLLLGQKASKKGAGPTTRYFPLAMWSHRLVPPPEDTVSSVGESRSAKRAPIGLEFGPVMDPEELGGRKKFGPAAEAIVRKHYDHLDKAMTR